MPDNQNPVYTDNSTITGDGTIENPLSASSSGSITEIESTDDSIEVTNGTGPVVDLSVNAPVGSVQGSLIIANNAATKLSVAQAGTWTIQSNGSGGFGLVGLQVGDVVCLLENLTVGGVGRIFNCGAGAGGGPGTWIVTQDGSMTAEGLHINFPALQVFANNAAAIAGGLVAGDLYRSGADPDGVFVVH